MSRTLRRTSNPHSEARSPSPFGVSEAVKKSVSGTNNGTCWLCSGGSRLDIAHLLDKKDTKLLLQYEKCGLLKAGDINSEDNLIGLCPNCHQSFDWRTPGWVFLPSNLGVFLDEERQFQRARQAYDGRGRVPERKEHARDGMFQPYRIRGNMGEGDGAWKGPRKPRKWLGDPIMAILRSYAIASGLERLSEEKGGLPKEVVDMYLELVGLYGTAAPKIVKPPEVIPKPDKGGVGDTITVNPHPPKAAGEIYETIHVIPPIGMTRNDEARKMMPPLKTPKRNNKRPLTDDGCPSESDMTSKTSNETGRSNDSQLTQIGRQLRSSKRLQLDSILQTDHGEDMEDWAEGMRVARKTRG